MYPITQNDVCMGAPIITQLHAGPCVVTTGEPRPAQSLFRLRKGQRASERGVCCKQRLKMDRAGGGQSNIPTGPTVSCKPNLRLPSARRHNSELVSHM